MTSFRNSLAQAGAAALVLLAAFAGPAQAAGTASGTAIPNSAKLNYTIGGNNQEEICSGETPNNTKTCAPTIFTVDTKIDVLVSVSDTTAQSSTPGGKSTLTFTVKNQGNSVQDIGLEALRDRIGTVQLGSTTFTDNFSPDSCDVYSETGTSPMSPARLSAVDPNALPTVVKVVCTFPTLKDGTTPFALTDVAVVALRATVQAAGGGALTASSGNAQGGAADILFADVAGSDDTVGARDAQHSARSAFKMKPALLSVAKTMQTLCDPISGATSPKNVPGAIVRYTITVSNAADASTATLTTISDVLNGALVFDRNLVTGANTAQLPSVSCSTAGGAPASAANAGVRFRVTNSTRANNNTYVFGSSPTVLTGTGPDTLTFNATTAWPTALPAEGSGLTAYTLGDLKAGETLTIEFNAIVQ
jgi:hypothetical protein